MRARIYSSFSDIGNATSGLLEEVPDTSFDQSPVWFDVLAAHILEPEERLQIVCVGDDDLAAMLPLVARRTGGGILSGHHLNALSNYYTAHFGPVIWNTDNSGDVVSCLADALVNDLPRWDALDLNPVAADATWATGLADQLRSRSCYVSSYFRFGNWYLEVDGRDFDEYFSGLSGRLRNTVKRKTNKLQRERSFEIELISDAGLLDRAFANYWEIYRKSWKQDEPFPQFIEQICSEFAQRGWLRFGYLSVDGEPAAAQIWFVRDGTASIFKLAYDPDFSQYSVGSILTKRLMQHVIDEDKVSVVDYLCGDDSYKQDWMSHRRERSGLRIYRLWSPGGLIRAGYDVLSRAIKSAFSMKSNRG